ncbi:MAG: 1-acylglycerol-3-phosphate O-acyltransferase [Flavobacteriales bacterium]|nr:1-acylglycerol-3-phosphate O-acyltransferase [Flavobacteriales bacterium]
MSVLLVPFQVIYKFYFSLYFALSLILFYPIFRIFLYKKERFGTAFKIMKIYGNLWLFCTGIRLQVKGKSNIIKDKPFIICSNHSSFVDIPCLYSIFDNYFVFTGKQEIEKWPLFNIFYTSGMNILVDRKNKLGIMKSFKKMMKTIDEGHPIVIFPEGTISKVAPSLTEFKSGAVNLAIQKQVPIIPITFVTNWKRLQRKGFWKGKAGPGIAEVIIHPQINTIGITKNESAELQTKLKNIINSPLQERYSD